jgi:hypothetical protein
MSPEKQRTAIAKACGWTEIDELLANTSMGKPPGKICSFDYLPDYLGDLNACHEMEKGLTYEQIDDYYIELAKRMVRPFRATASQRAEAFLRTLELWQPTPTQLQ